MVPNVVRDDRIVNANRIKCLDGRDKHAATPHMGREQRELVLVPLFSTSVAGSLLIVIEIIVSANY
jgi:hypothetical protein